MTTFFCLRVLSTPSRSLLHFVLIGVTLVFTFAAKKPNAEEYELAYAHNAVGADVHRNALGIQYMVSIAE
jgi:hypothetical protein